MGLLITPSGMRLPFSVSYYTEAYCKAKKIAYRKQTELAAQLIRQLPLPPEAARGGPGRHRLRRQGHPHCLRGTQF